MTDFPGQCPAADDAGEGCSRTAHGDDESHTFEAGLLTPS